MDGEIRAITLNCSNCGSSLEISNDMSQFACGYCGSILVVERQGGTVALKKVVDAVEKVQIGTDKTAAELALRRLKEELDGAEANLRNAQKKIMTFATTSPTTSSSAPVLRIILMLAAIVFLLGGLMTMFGEISAFVPGLVGIFLGLALGFLSLKVKKGKSPEEVDTNRGAEKIAFLRPYLQKVAELKTRIREQKAIADGTGVLGEDEPDAIDRDIRSGEKRCAFCMTISPLACRRCKCGFVWPG